jgi:hypothetical protein
LNEENNAKSLVDYQTDHDETFCKDCYDAVLEWNGDQTEPETEKMMRQLTTEMVELYETTVEFAKLYPTSPPLTTELAQDLLAFFKRREDWEGEFDEGTYSQDHPDCLWMFWIMYRIVDSDLWTDWCEGDHEPDFEVLREAERERKERNAEWNGAGIGLRKAVEAVMG